MYALKDIAVVIATYNRAEDLKISLESFKRSLPSLNEVLIVDQSKTTETKDLVASLKNKKVRYFHSPFASLARARNLGAKHLADSTKIVVFMDDDASLPENYFEAILEVFNGHPEAKGVSAYVQQPEVTSQNRFEPLLRRVFFLSRQEKESMRVLSTYGNTYPVPLSKTIQTQWLSGVNMVYKKEVCEDLQFDNNLTGYSLAEDFDFSYRLYKRFPNSLFITPSAQVLHRVSLSERYPTQKIAYVNQINHVYFNFKNFNNTIKEKLIFVWVLFGITLLRTLLFAKTLKKSEGLKLKYYLASLWYCFVHLHAIRKGDLDSYSENIPKG